MPSHMHHNVHFMAKMIPIIALTITTLSLSLYDEVIIIVIVIVIAITLYDGACVSTSLPINSRIALVLFTMSFSVFFFFFFFYGHAPDPIARTQNAHICVYEYISAGFNIRCALWISRRANKVILSEICSWALYFLIPYTGPSSTKNFQKYRRGYSHIAVNPALIYILYVYILHACLTRHAMCRATSRHRHNHCTPMIIMMKIIVDTHSLFLWRTHRVQCSIVQSQRWLLLLLLLLFSDIEHDFSFLIAKALNLYHLHPTFYNLIQSKWSL